MYTNCKLCPRRCGVNRTAGERGVCGQTSEMRVSRAALHYWEEPCISGSAGSGTVFFTGCSLGCVYCQNAAISGSGSSEMGTAMTSDELAETFLKLQGDGAHNINLVTPTHFIPGIRAALETARISGLTIPVVYNTGGYEDPEVLRSLEGLVDVWIPDCKYYSDESAIKYSRAPGYYRQCISAIREMLRQSGRPVFSDTDGNRTLTATEYNDLCADLDDGDDYRAPIMTRGVIVRHLVLPGYYDDSVEVIRGIHENFGDDVYFSLMSQYTPMQTAGRFPELGERIDMREYDRLTDLCIKLNMENMFFQGEGVAEESFIPEFN